MSIKVSWQRCAIVVAALGFTAGARADLRTAYSLGPVVYPGGDVTDTRGVAVDNNIKSAWYGCVFVADAGGTEAAPQRRVMIFRPDPISDGPGATSYVDTGVTISVPDQPGGGGGVFAPFGVFVGEDDTVWITNYDDRTVETIGLPAAIPAAGSLGATTIQIRMADFDDVAKTSSGGTTDPAGSSPRAVFVNGPVTNANVFLGNYDGFVNVAQRYTVVAPNASTSGAANHIYTTQVASSIGPYGIAADPDNNAYVPVRVVSGGNAIWKLDSGGARDTTTFSGLLPDGYVGSVYASIAFTKDSASPGGGYLYDSFRNGTTGDTVVLRYDLNGNYLEGFGTAGSSPIANFTPLPITGTLTQYVAADDQGNVYQRYQNGSNTAVIKINRKAPFVVASSATTSAGGAVHSSPTAVDGVVYFGSDDGKLHAYDTTTGNPVPGFPVNVSDEIRSRAAVYITTAGKGIYFTTNNGIICRVNGDGTGLTYSNPYLGFTADGNVGTPAVTPDGTVYVGTKSQFSGTTVFKLNPDLTLAAFQKVANVTATVTSVAVSGNNVYVGITGGAGGDIMVLKASDLTPQAAGVASGEGVTAPPFVNGLDAYVGANAGNFYKVNSITFAPDPTFGAANVPATPGMAAIGEDLPGSAFNDGNTFYVGSENGKVWQVDGTTGAFSVFYDTGDATAEIPGVVVNPGSHTLAFGSSAGAFYEVPTDITSGPVNAMVFRGYGAFHTTPTLDRDTGRFLIGSDDKNVYAFSSR